MRYPEVAFRLPGWVDEVIPDPARIYPTVDDRMGVVIELAHQNVQRGTGGPFAAAVFDARRHTLVAPGVNMVVPMGYSVAHGEVMAIVIAQRLIGTHDLGGAGLPPFELVTSTEPCAMCLGALPWSGIRRLACGARDEDARAVGFDEGDKPANWPGLLERRGIGVTRDVRRGEAAAVLRQYVANGGRIYGSGQRP
jgi:tRNA(Arg) A34 adenosine deaminase TadA